MEISCKLDKVKKSISIYETRGKNFFKFNMKSISFLWVKDIKFQKYANNVRAKGSL